VAVHYETVQRLRFLPPPMGIRLLTRSPRGRGSVSALLHSFLTVPPFSTNVKYIEQGQVKANSNIIWFSRYFHGAHNWVRFPIYITLHRFHGVHGVFEYHRGGA
jgi:hypothetical protein